MFGTRVHPTCSPCCPGLSGAALAAASHSPGSLMITALVTLLQSVSPPDWRSPSQRSRSVAFGRWCPTALVQFFNIPQLFFRLGSWNFLLHFRPAFRGCSSDGNPSRPLDRWLLSYWRFFAALSISSSTGRTSRTSAPLLALSTGLMIFPALWQVSWGPRSLRATPKSRLTFPGSWSGGAVLALVRPVVSYTPALSSALAAGGVSGSVLYNNFLVDRLPPKLPTAGWLFVLGALLAFLNLKY